MRVLHLPVNIASQISVTVRALRDIGVDARGMVINSSLFQDDTGINKYKIVSRRKHPFRGIIQTLIWWKQVFMGLSWADVVHWHFSGLALPCELDLKYAALLNKARIVEFWGSDIRIPEIAADGNPYVSKLFSDPNNDYRISYQRSRNTQEKFARYGFECLIPGHELHAYVQRDLFPSPFRIEAGLILSKFNPKYPNPSRHRPVVVHIPSRLMAKGTPTVLHAIERLKIEYDFEFRLVHKVAHSEAHRIIQDCDILLDQFITGGFGVVALEDMAMGKPVICYIPSLMKNLPSDFPIINANQDNLVEVLAVLLKDGHRRHQIGRHSRAYVEKYHDAHKNARDLVKIYEELIRRTHNKKK